MAKSSKLGAKTFDTVIDVPENAKQVSIGILNACLIDAIDLYNATRQAHWNVKGPHFHSIHELLDGFYNALNTSTDDLAERIVQLGGTAHGTTQEIAANTRLEPYPTDVYGGLDNIKLLAARYGAVGKALRKGIDDTDEAGDKDSSDLLTEKSREIDKMTWMIEAFLKADN
ncbi:DNA starvation/stationary phase protection protein Dps [Roseomonas sp. NAR14]|uniref:DNA starvation/stationary phase protection protein Dps n=1 Tax=Roseomonas acroporae TaxID=2937791 RepID=A0A9X1Y6U7_9PROT|nr:DNA starvation/stationary phase protection protein Dps [Roseomonas acroporae]MCK8783290.1 DNA starvation/stationary phase protection protein Dps [Roseomonas acroporae]